MKKFKSNDNLTKLDSDIISNQINFNLHLNLMNYKTIKCNLNKNHNCLRCFNYHNEKDKRRNPFYYEYDIILCTNKKNCINKKYCKFSHNKIEILYHPFFYKKKYCINYYKKGVCKYKEYCSFAHNDLELKIKVIHKIGVLDKDFFLFHFKTEFCPLGNIKHDKKKCFYAHNFKEYKRKNINHILPIKCKNWNFKKFYTKYEDGCKNGYNCKFAHGINEINYNKGNFLNRKNVTYQQIENNRCNQNAIKNRRCFKD